MRNLKKLLALAVALCIALSIGVFVSASSPMYGDANVDGKIIRKTDLKNHTVIVVKLIIHNTFLALADVNVNNEKKELTGIRMLRFQGRYIYQKYTFYLDGYRRKWIAYTRL